MKKRRIATFHLPGFGLQVTARPRRALLGSPLALETGPEVPGAQGGRVAECSRRAADEGVRAGQSLARARSLCPGLRVIRSAPEEMAAARREILEALLAFSPQVAWGGGGSFYLNAEGLAPLLGSERVLLVEGLARLSALGFLGRAGCAGTRFASSLAARRGRGPTVVPEGGEGIFLAGLPLSVLPLAGVGGKRLQERLLLLGIRTLGQLAALPAAGLADRFGAELLRCHRLARGEELELLAPPCESPGPRAQLELDEPVGGLEPVTFLLKSCCEELCAQLAARGTAVARIELRIALDGAAEDRRELAPSRAMRKPRPLLDLCRLELEARGLAAPILGLRLQALEELPVQEESSRLFGRRIDGAGLAAALDRLRTLLGPERVVSPAPREAHRREARIAWESYEPRRARRALPQPPSEPLPGAANPQDAERILARPLPIRVRLPRASGEDAEPGLLIVPGARSGLPESTPLLAQSGPCRIAGEWWEGGADVDRDEHLLIGADGGRYLAFRDRRSREWFLLGVED